MKKNLVTFATMVQTDGTTTTYGIFRGRVRGSGRRMYLDLNARDTTFVTNITTKRHPERHALKQFYLELAQPYATADAPAFSL